MNSTRHSSANARSAHWLGQVLCAFALTYLPAGTASANPALGYSIKQPPYSWEGDCRLCHQETNGKAGSATQPFAETLKDRGIGALSTPGQLNAVLDDLDEDSDGDGLSDVEELLSGGDPNRGKGQKALRAIEYRYGCLNLSAGPTHSPWSSAFGALVLGLCVLRRSRRHDHR